MKQLGKNFTVRVRHLLKFSGAWPSSLGTLLRLTQKDLVITYKKIGLDYNGLSLSDDASFIIFPHQT